jgi:hypothetical protein
MRKHRKQLKLTPPSSEWEEVTSFIKATSAKERLRNLVLGQNVISHLESVTAFKLIRIVPLQTTPV